VSCNGTYEAIHVYNREPLVPLIEHQADAEGADVRAFAFFEQGEKLVISEKTEMFESCPQYQAGVQRRDIRIAIVDFFNAASRLPDV
jgi:hypothetical protein